MNRNEKDDLFDAIKLLKGADIITANELYDLTARVQYYSRDPKVYLPPKIEYLKNAVIELWKLKKRDVHPITPELTDNAIKDAENMIEEMEARVNRRNE